MTRKIKLLTIFICVMALNFSLNPFSMQVMGSNQNHSKSPILTMQQILVMVETDMATGNSRKGDDISLKTMNDIYLNENNILIPTGSKLYGYITGVKKAGFFHKDPYIRIAIDIIKAANGESIIMETPIETEIYAPDSKKIKDKIIDKLPSAVAQSGTSFALGQASSIAKEAIWGISAGTGIFVGIVSGFVAPERGKTRTQTSADRAFSSSPAGTVKTVMETGKDFRIESGQFINIYLDKRSIKLIQAGV